MEDYRQYLTGTDRLDPKWVQALKTRLNTMDHINIAIEATSSRTYVRDVLYGYQPIRQPKARAVLFAAMRIFNSRS